MNDSISCNARSKDQDRGVRHKQGESSLSTCVLPMSYPPALLFDPHPNPKPHPLHLQAENVGDVVWVKLRGHPAWPARKTLPTTAVQVLPMTLSLHPNSPLRSYFEKSRSRPIPPTRSFPALTPQKKAASAAHASAVMVTYFGKKQQVSFVSPSSLTPWRSSSHEANSRISVTAFR